jgi:hypothetical protein
MTVLEGSVAALSVWGKATFLNNLPTAVIIFLRHIFIRWTKLDTSVANVCMKCMYIAPTDAIHNYHHCRAPPLFDQSLTNAQLEEDVANLISGAHEEAAHTERRSRTLTHPGDL